MNPRNRVRFAWCVLIVSILGWPLSAVTFARGEPKTVLALSWIAITLTAVNVLFTSDVRRTQDQEDPGE